MNIIINTYELENYIKTHYVSKIKYIWDIDVKLRGVSFSNGVGRYEEEKYAFSDENGYNYIFPNKDGNREHFITNNILEIAYWIIDYEVYEISMMFTVIRKSNVPDFRARLFVESLMIWRSLDEFGYEKKLAEIISTIEAIRNDKERDNIESVLNNILFA